MAAGYTGGTAAPGAPSAPRVPAPRPQGPPRPGKGGGGPGQRYYNKASGKMETAQAMRNYRAPVRPAAASRALGAPAGKAPAAKAAAAPKSPYVGGEILNLPNQGRAEKQNIAGSINRILQANERTAAQPFQQKAGEIGNVEQTVAGRFANVNQGAVANAQGLLGNAEASAKTFENQAAENALSANRAVETAGQNAVTANAGQLPPELRGQLAFNEGQIRGIGAAGEQRANELGANAVAYQRALAAAAVQRGQEGQQNIVNTYGAQRGKNQAEQNRAIERERGKAKEQRITLPQELNKMRLAETLGQGRLAEGQAKLAQGAAKIAQGNTKLALTASGQVNKRQETQERVKATERGQTLAQYRAQAANEQRERASERGRETGRERNQNQARRNEISQGQYEESDRIAREKIQASLRKTASSPAAYKLGGELGSAYNSISLMRTGQKKAGEGPQPAQMRAFLSTGQSFKSNTKAGKVSIKVAKVQNPVLQNAAIELWYNPGHKVSAATNAELGAMGINLGQVKAALGI